MTDEYKTIENEVHSETRVQGSRFIATASPVSTKKATYAFDVFCYRVKKYIGAYAAAMGGLDVVVFTGGIGENSVEVRQACCEGLEFLGIHFDEASNASPHREKHITRPDSKTAVLVIPTNEELVIAMDTKVIVDELRIAAAG